VKQYHQRRQKLTLEGSYDKSETISPKTAKVKQYHQRRQKLTLEGSYDTS